VTILPAWWQRLWLRAAMAFALVGVIITAIARRVRSLQAQQSASADLSRQLIRSQEQERARLAAELHDGLAQQLQLIRNRAELALDRHRPDENAARELLAISATASRAISSVRAITRGLRPPEIDQLGLTQALRWLAELVASSFRGKLEARVDGVDGVLSREDEVHVYRVAQEALNNAVKHGEASEITFEVERRPDAVHLSIYDDGRGFNPEAVAANPHSGSGLKTLKERAVMLGGALELRSEPGVGTRLTLRVPTVQRTAPPA
jgi:signal transduction histidine kinase